MVKRDPTRDALEQLAVCKSDPASERSRKAIRTALQGRISVAVARAATLIRQHDLPGFDDALAAAHARWLKKPARSDRGCTAKIALARALDAVGCPGAGPFLAGVKHIQLDPVYGGHEDTAAELRSRSAAALVRLRHPDAFRYVADLLYDPWPAARLGAVAVARYAGNEAAELLLRAKALSGDEDARVVGDCLSALAEMAPRDSLSFLARFLDADDEALVEYAALALGETREAEAFALLEDAWGRWGAGQARHMLLLPMALLRSDESFAFLLQRVESSPVATAQAALTALESARANPELAGRVFQALDARDDDTLAGELELWQ